MLNLYERNGLIFWNEKQIKIREMLKEFFVNNVRETLRDLNKAFDMIQVEAPLLTPVEFINPQYSASDMYIANGHFQSTAGFDLVLRPETTMGSYRYAKHLLETHSKIKLPVVIWQHGKSFRREQDQVTKNMRLKEFYQLEFQCIYGLTTANDYSATVVPAVHNIISRMLGDCRIEDSDRLPNYAEWTKDIVVEKNNMEVCSISQRKDFPNAKVLEIAIGTDRCVYNFDE